MTTIELNSGLHRITITEQKTKKAYFCHLSIAFRYMFNSLEFLLIHRSCNYLKNWEFLMNFDLVIYCEKNGD